MLDVHPPEHPISGRRDFVIHLLTITVGLLIALALENLAEAGHHYYERREAEASIRAEMQKNRDDVAAYAPILKQEGEDMIQVLTFVEARAKGDMHPPPKLSLAFHESPIPDAAWRTASATGALSYLPYDEVERFSEAYKEQDMLQAVEERALEDYLQLEPLMLIHNDPATMTQDQAKAALPLVQQAIAHLAGMSAIGKGAAETYADALK